MKLPVTIFGIFLAFSTTHAAGPNLDEIKLLEIDQKVFTSVPVTCLEMKTLIDSLEIAKDANELNKFDQATEGFKGMLDPASYAQRQRERSLQLVLIDRNLEKIRAQFNSLGCQVPSSAGGLGKIPGFGIPASGTPKCCSQYDRTCCN